MTSLGAHAPPSPDLTFYAYALLRRVGRLSSIFFPSEDLSRHLRATLPEGESFFIYPEVENFLIFIYYVNTYLVLFCSAIHFMDIVIWISIAPLYKTTSKFFHVKFFIVPLKLLDTLHKHGYNVECKIV